MQCDLKKAYVTEITTEIAMMIIVELWLVPHRKRPRELLTAMMDLRGLNAT